MAEQILSAKVEVDISQATGGLSQLGKGVNESIKRIEALEKELASLQKSFTAATGKISALEAKLAVPSAPKFTKNVQGGTQALTDFSRVVQDAPFGLIGIGNNITQLADSFGRLKAESGSGKAAFSALIGSLTGPAGLSLAISAVITGLTFAQTGFAAWTRKTKEAKEETDKWAESQRKNAEHIEKQRIETEQLVKVATGDIGTKAEQKAALDKLNSVIPDYIGHLDAQNIKTEKGAEIIDKYTRALEKQAVAELLIGRVAEIRGKQFDNEIKLKEELLKNAIKQDEIENQLKKEQGKFPTTFQAIEHQGELIQSLNNRLLNLKDDAKELTQSFIKDNKSLEKSISDLRKEIDKNTVVIDISGDAKTKKVKKDIEEQLKASDINLPIRTVTLESGLEIRAADTERLRKGLNEQLRQGGFLNKIDTSKALPTLEPTKLIDVPAFNTQLALFNRTLSTQLSESAKITAEKTKAIVDQMAGLNQQINNLVQNAQISFFTGIGEAIATSITEGVPFVEQAAKVIFSTIGDFISQLGQAMITYGVTMQGAQAAFAAGFAIPGAVAIAAGVAAVAAGQLLKSVPQFANGGVVNGPTMGVLGEANKSEAIIPLDRLEAMMSNNGGGGTLVTEISGDKLRLILDRTDRRQRRNF